MGARTGVRRLEGVTERTVGTRATLTQINDQRVWRSFSRTSIECRSTGHAVRSADPVHGICLPIVVAWVRTVIRGRLTVVPRPRGHSWLVWIASTGR
jgi:hypothetical protein